MRNFETGQRIIVNPGENISLYAEVTRVNEKAGYLFWKAGSGYAGGCTFSTARAWAEEAARRRRSR